MDAPMMVGAGMDGVADDGGVLCLVWGVCYNMIFPIFGHMQ